MSRQLDELAAEVRDMRHALDTLAADVAAVRLLLEGKPRRDTLIRDLADKLGLGGPTWAAANAVVLILAGIRPPPVGAESALLALAGTRLSPRQVLRILQAGTALQAADKSRALCQWPMARHDAAIVNDEHEDAR